jgi:hypothetical protein
MTEIFWIILLIIFVGNALPTPNWMWKWRIHYQYGEYYPQAIGILKPWWHNIPTIGDFDASYETYEEARQQLLGIGVVI